MNDRQNRALDTLLSTDAYKLDHRRQYPKGTEFVYSNLTARGTRLADVDATVFFGLQAYLQQLRQRWQVFFDLAPDELDAGRIELAHDGAPSRIGDGRLGGACEHPGDHDTSLRPRA